MQFLYVILVLVFLVMGMLQFKDMPTQTIHFFIMALFFFVIFLEFRGTPFHRHVYVLISVLLLGDALIQFFLAQNNVIGGIVSLILAYLTLQSRHRIHS